MTVDPELVDAGNKAVAAGLADSLSGWVNAALADRAIRDGRLRALSAAIADYEAELGVITSDEIAGRAASRPGDRRRRQGSPGRGGAVTLVLDSGALVALARDERAMWVRLRAAWLRAACR